jgi:hypothetical protein
MKRVLTVLVLLGLVGNVCASWDLKADWSNTANPNSPWSYGGGSGGVFSLLPTQYDNWVGLTGQTAWAPSSNDIPGWCKSVGDLFSGGILTGDVFGHIPAMIRWTSPVAGTITVTGTTWRPRSNGGGPQQMTVLENGDWGNNTPAQIHPYVVTFPENDRAHAVPFTQTFDVVVGQNVQFLVDRGPGSNYGDFVALDARITLIPEPMTLSLLGLGSLALLRRRSKV